ncbi:MAG: PAS domain-containing protein [Desulfobacteraceae bacterium]|nr:PAS domain-containing protein [Desulfobacteraceae bacterium]
MLLSPKTLNDFENILPAVLYEYTQNQDGYSIIRYMSPNSREILGYSAEKFIGNSLSSFLGIVHVEDQKRLESEDSETIEDDFFSTEIRIVLPSGDIKWILLRSKPSDKTRSGEVTWVGCIVDITDQMKLAFEKEYHLKELQKAIDEIKILKGILPLCSYCKKIRDDKGYWNQVDAYINDHSEASISHGICPECAKKYYPDYDIYEK